MDLQTQYLGLELKNPLIAGASPLSDDISKVRALEDSGIAAITMYSLFEEQITQNLVSGASKDDEYSTSFVEAASNFPDSGILDRGLDTYLGQLQEVKAAVDIPVIGSLNGNREGEWVNYASLIESEGADALELNLYYLATRLDESSADIEDRYLRIVKLIREKISIPLLVKLSPSFTALPAFSKRLAEAGVDALVLFNRMYQPDIDVEGMVMQPSLKLSYSHELLLRLRWLALLSCRVDCQLAASGGVHTGIDVIKSLMAGADVIQLVSTLLINGPEHVVDILKEMETWLEDKGHTNLESVRGSMNYQDGPVPEALERANYMRILKSWRSHF